jgi:hypothetical protein
LDSSSTDVIWGGTKDGALFELEVPSGTLVDHRPGVHSGVVTGVWRVARDNKMASLDETGKLQLWPSGDLAALPRTQRLAGTGNGGDKVSAGGYSTVLGTQLWTASRPSGSTRSPSVRVYDLSSDGAAFNVTTRPATMSSDGAGIGGVTAATVLPARPNKAYLAHETGHVSIWDRASGTCEQVVKVSTFQITVLVGVGRQLWAGYRTGMLFVYDTGADGDDSEPKSEPWKVLKKWQAHADPIMGLAIDPTLLETVSIWWA